MVIDSSITTWYSVVSEFEGTILKNEDSFSYFMLLAFEVSGLIRFTILLFLWPIIALQDVFGFKNASIKLMIFVATAGVHESEIELVARAVLPKFYMDDISMDTWRVFSSCKKRIVVTRMPRIMVEMFAKENLSADEVIGTELIVNRFGYFTGLICETDIDQSVLSYVGKLFVNRRPHLGLGRPAKIISTTFLSLCEEKIHAPVHCNHLDQQLELQPPKPVIFHDGRFVKQPTPATALLILLWIPFGIILAVIRIFLIFIIPLWAIPYVIGILRIRVTIKGKPMQPPATRNSGLLFVGNHKTFLDGFVVSYALGRRVPCFGFALWRLSVLWFFLDKLSISWLQNIFPPVPIVWLLRNRDIDAETIKQVLSKGDATIFPEGASFNEPFLLRFSALFAELTDGIVPVAVNGGTDLTVGSSAGFFRATTRGWACLNVFLIMNPTLVYELTFLDQLPLEETCSSGKSPYHVANHVQRILADTLGFECTNFTRKDKYKRLT